MDALAFHTSLFWMLQCFPGRYNASFLIKMGVFFFKSGKKVCINFTFTKKMFKKCMLNFTKCIFSLYRDVPVPILLTSICYSENCYWFPNVTFQNKFHLIVGSLNVLLTAADILFRIFAWYSQVGLDYSFLFLCSLHYVLASLLWLLYKKNLEVFLLFLSELHILEDD